MNARLAARLTGWRIDIKSESTFALEESQTEFGAGGEGALVRCAALLRNGKRCVNAALPGTRYCSLPAHARLAEMEAAGQVVGPTEAVSLDADGGAEAPAAAEVEIDATPVLDDATTEIETETKTAPESETDAPAEASAPSENPPADEVADAAGAETDQEDAQ